MLALHVTPANEQDRTQVALLAEAVQDVSDSKVEVAFVDQGYTGEAVCDAAEAHRIELEVVKTPEAKRGFIVLPRRWVVERPQGWAARFRRLAWDHERLVTSLAELHDVAFSILMLHKAVPLFCWSS